MCDSFASACTEFGVVISLGKTEVMGQNTPTIPHITINGTELNTVKRFTYLGSTVCDTNSLDTELDVRIGKASTTFGRLQKRVWGNGNLYHGVKFEVYKACILSVLLYGSESWTTHMRHEHRLNAFHFRCLRSILGLTWEDRVPNTEILQISKLPDMYTLLRARRLRWTGHVVRMTDDRLPKAILYGELKNATRPVGRPKLRFKDCLKRDLTSFDIDHASWEVQAQDRPAWRANLTKGSVKSVENYIDFCNRRRRRRHHQK